MVRSLSTRAADTGYRLERSLAADTARGRRVEVPPQALQVEVATDLHLDDACREVVRRARFDDGILPRAGTRARAPRRGPGSASSPRSALVDPDLERLLDCELILLRLACRQAQRDSSTRAADCGGTPIRSGYPRIPRSSSPPPAAGASRGPWSFHRPARSCRRHQPFLSRRREKAAGDVAASGERKGRLRWEGAAQLCVLRELPRWKEAPTRENLQRIRGVSAAQPRAPFRSDGCRGRR